MYNKSERSTNHIDIDSTLGNFRHLFELRLYGYYFESGCGYADKPGYLKFTLFFANPFDPKTRPYNKPDQWPCKEELDGFKDKQSIEQEIKRKNIQLVTLEYKNACCYEDPGFIEQLLGKKSYLPQVCELKENSLLYKVSFDIPFEAIMDYVNVDKIQMDDNGAFEKKISLYNPQGNGFLVEKLFRKLNRVESLMTEMGSMVKEIRSHPEIYEQTHEFTLGHTECHKFYKQCYDSDEHRRVVEGYNMEHAEQLLHEAKEAFEKMDRVIYNARWLDVNVEPKEVENSKVSYVWKK